MAGETETKLTWDICPDFKAAVQALPPEGLITIAMCEATEITPPPAPSQEVPRKITDGKGESR